jgi:hypothetical protein
LPSATAIAMFANVRTSPGPGVPESTPDALSVAQAGTLTAPKVSRSPSASLAVGAKE